MRTEWLPFDSKIYVGRTEVRRHGRRRVRLNLMCGFDKVKPGCEVTVNGNGEPVLKRDSRDHHVRGRDRLREEEGAAQDYEVPLRGASYGEDGLTLVNDYGFLGR